MKAAVVVVLLALLGPPAHARATPALKGITILEGTRAASMSVRVPSTARFGVADVTVRGVGRYAGVVLVSLTGRFVIAGRATRIAVRQTFRDNPATDAVVPAGEYRLYLLAEHGFTSVSLRLHGLRGSTVLRPSSRARFQIASVHPNVRVDGAQVLYWGGASARMGRGIVYSTLTLVSDVHVAGSYRFCESRAASYTTKPACLGAGTSVGVDAVEPSTSRRVFNADAFDESPGGTVAAGWWYASAALVKQVSALTWWLTY